MTDFNFTHSKAKINPAKTISKLLKMRRAIGAHTLAGHRISNMDEIRQNQEKATSPEQLANLDASMSRQWVDFELVRGSAQ